MEIAWGETLQLAATLFFIIDPLGNIPIFNSILQDYEPRRRMKIIGREMIFALIILLTFLYIGTSLLGFLGLQQPSLNIAGGILLFLIALHMLYPDKAHTTDPDADDPFIVPLATPLTAGPSSIAVLLLISSSQPERLGEATIAVLIAWTLSTVILLVSPLILRFLGHRGVRALERLMGMLLVLIAVQMFLNGTTEYVMELYENI
jgi:multiple antibiotic resistance protein